MKRSTNILICIAAACFILSIVMFSQTKFRQSPQISSSSEQIHSTANYASSQENSNITAMTSKTTVYTVKEYKGHIGVFMNDETVPYKEVMVEVASLPETDQQLLSKGIMANNQSKLNHILEDYRS